MNPKTKPTEAELEILQVLWQSGPSTVRQVHEVLESKDVGYTTTLKIMQIMTEKGLLSRDLGNRSHLYTAAATETDTKRSLLNRFLQTTFGGSTSQLVMQALGDHKASPDELKQIRELLNQIEKQP